MLPHLGVGECVAFPAPHQPSGLQLPKTMFATLRVRHKKTNSVGVKRAGFLSLLPPENQCLGNKDQMEDPSPCGHPGFCWPRSPCQVKNYWRCSKSSDNKLNSPRWKSFAGWRTGSSRVCVLWKLSRGLWSICLQMCFSVSSS